MNRIEGLKNELNVQKSNLEYFLTTCHSKFIRQTQERICIINSELELLEELVEPTEEEIEKAEQMRKEYNESRNNKD